MLMGDLGDSGFRFGNDVFFLSEKVMFPGRTVRLSACVDESAKDIRAGGMGDATPAAARFPGWKITGKPEIPGRKGTGCLRILHEIPESDEKQMGFFVEKSS